MNPQARVVVNVSLGNHYMKGQRRLTGELHKFGQGAIVWGGALPDGCPSHAARPYAFKAYAMKWAADRGHEQIMWLDSSIVPVADLTPIWNHAEVHGAWLSNNGFSNYEWTADSAYIDLFPEYAMKAASDMSAAALESGAYSEWTPASMARARAKNREVRHVVGGAVAVDLRHPSGRAFLAEYYRLASETDAFVGPWTNAGSRHRNPNDVGPRVYPCGPEDVRGHRHDQTAMSVIAWRLGIEPTNPPYFFSYRGGENESTILVADGNY